MTEHYLLGKKILVLTAHPDDESFLAAGTLYKNKLAGGQNFLVVATLGEKGSSHLKEPLSEEQLMAVRAEELAAASKMIGIDALTSWRFPDGGLASQVEELFRDASGLINQFEPDIVMSFGPDGATGHRDHIAAASVAERLAAEFRLPLAQFCFPQSLRGEIKDWLQKRRHQLDHYEDDYELTEENLSVTIDGDIKLKALLCYDSQIDEQQPFAGFPDHVAEALIKVECFHLVTPRE